MALIVTKDLDWLWGGGLWLMSIIHVVHVMALVLSQQTQIHMCLNATAPTETNVHTHISIEKSAWARACTYKHRGCSSALCLRVYDGDLKQCSFLSKHLIIPAGCQHGRESQSLSCWVEMFSPFLLGALCFFVCRCVFYLRTISIYLYTVHAHAYLRENISSNLHLANLACWLGIAR